jgi:phosphopantothenoylcysteine decarboxylase/phosphopantothenate--cysteine ligase
MQDARSFFKNKKVLITLGPTREYMDSVRFLSNASSGKMGIAVAQQLQDRGAKVFLICGPGVACPRNLAHVSVVSALQMKKEVLCRFPGSDFFISVAAVSDFRPKRLIRAKIKRAGSLRVELVPNPDILALAGRKKKKQFCIGFALEEVMDLQEAKRKMRQKNCDLVVLNTKDSMEADLIHATILFRNGMCWSLGKISKTRCAEKLCQAVLEASSKKSEVPQEPRLRGWVAAPPDRVRGRLLTGASSESQAHRGSGEVR